MSQLKIKNGGSWEAIPAGGVGVPSGGSSGQFLKKSSSTDYATEWADLPGLDLLWTNPNINTGFNAQDLSLNISDYTFFLIVMRNSLESNTADAYSCQIISKWTTNTTNCARLFAWAADNQPLYRGYYFISNGIHFNRSYYGTGSAQGTNAYCTPYKIYGIRWQP